MLFAISGSQGSGKSTLISALKERGFSTVERKTSRSILKDWGVELRDVNNDADLTIKFQEEIIIRKHDDDISAEGDCVITERTFMDLAAYTLAAMGKDMLHSDWIDQYIERCAEQQKIYDMVFYLTAGHFTVENDGVRNANRHYSRMIDLAMLDLTKRYTDEDKLIVINTPNIDARIGIVEGAAVRAV